MADEPSSTIASSSNTNLLIAPHAVTRSFARRVSSSSTAASTLEPPRTVQRSASGLPQRTTTASASRSRTLTSLSNSNSVAHSAAHASSSKPAIAPSTATRPRTLMATSSSGLHKPATTSSTRRVSRRLSRAEASAMTGMGVVKVGPAVHGMQRTPARPFQPRSRSDQEQENDPYSLSFKPQIRYTSDKSPEKVLRQLESPPAASTTNTYTTGTGQSIFGAHTASSSDTSSSNVLRQSVDPLILRSPPKPRAPASPPRMPQQSSARKRPFETNDGSLTPSARPLTSPARALQLSRPTVPGSSPSRPSSSTSELAKGGRDSLDVDLNDELDCLSPRKKKRSLSPIKDVELGSPTLTFETLQSADADATCSTPLLRREPTSVAMQRSPAMQLPPSFFAARPLESVAPVPYVHPAHFQTSPAPILAPSTHPSNFWQTLASPVRMAAAMNSPKAASPSSVAMMRSPAVSMSKLLPRSTTITQHDVDMDDVTIKVGSSAPLQAEANHSFESDSSHNSTVASIDMSDASSVSSSANESSASIDSVSSGNSSMSSATTEGLARLQSMLSRLQMPRQSMSSSTSRSAARGSSFSAALAPERGGLIENDRSALTGARTNLGLVLPSMQTGREPTTASVTATSNARVTTSVRRAAAPLRSTATQPGSTTPGRQGAPSNTAARLAARRQAAANAIAPLSQSSATIAAMANPFTGAFSSSTGSTSSSSTTTAKSLVLKGVIAFVDVRTGEGDDAGMLFVDMLKSMGARVTTRPTPTLTHVVWKSGKPLSKYLGSGSAGSSSAQRAPKIVGIGWVVRCAEVNQRVDETPFLVDLEQHQQSVTSYVSGSSGTSVAGPSGTQQRRRKSMEPKALSVLGARDANRRTTSAGAGMSGLTTVDEGGRASDAVQSEVDPAVKASIAASIDRARRKSLQFAPKVGSPLAKRVYSMPIEQILKENEETMDE
ncbi:hypothetical protein ACM66B_004655 [Microbotryomycetes sp. NB124-2]